MFERLSTRLARSALGPVVVVWAFGYILVDIFAFVLGRTQPGLNFLSSVPLFLLGIALTLVLDRLRRHLQDHPAAMRWTGLAVGLLAAVTIQAEADLHWLRWLAHAFFPDWLAWADAITVQRFTIAFVLYLWTYCLALTLIWAGGLIARAERAEAEAERAEAEADRAEAEADEAEAEADRYEAAAERAEAMALRLQLNPHFLFNTLNSISSLVTLDRKSEAQAMLDALGAFLRASLHSDPMADVTLAEELDTIDSYLDIESIRFGDRLTIEIDVEEGLSELPVPNFILQPLVENAVKYGVAAVRGPATLRICAARTEGGVTLAVINTCLPGAEAGEKRSGTGIGLANIRQRLDIRYDEQARLETGPVEHGWRAEIWVPA